MWTCPKAPSQRGPCRDISRALFWTRTVDVRLKPKTRENTLKLLSRASGDSIPSQICMENAIWWDYTQHNISTAPVAGGRTTPLEVFSFLYIIGRHCMFLFFGSHSSPLLLPQPDCVCVFKGVDSVVTELVGLANKLGLELGKIWLITYLMSGVERIERDDHS